MTSFIAESAVEEVCLDFFAELGWSVLYGPEIAPGEPGAERSSYRDVLLEGRLRSAVERLNPELSASEVTDVVATFRRPESVDLRAENWRTYSMLTRGVPVERRLADGSVRSDTARLVDFEDASRNDFVVVNQFSVEGDHHTRRPGVCDRFVGSGVTPRSSECGATSSFPPSARWLPGSAGWRCQ